MGAAGGQAWRERSEVSRRGRRSICVRRRRCAGGACNHSHGARHSRMMRWAAGVAIALVFGALVAAAGGWWTPWAARYIQGVDVSWHQGAIDWRTLAADDVAFAYIKATEGGDHVDERFAFNWREAGAAGLYRGAYHFF